MTDNNRREAVKRDSWIYQGFLRGWKCGRQNKDPQADERCRDLYAGAASRDDEIAGLRTLIAAGKRQHDAYAATITEVRELAEEPGTPDDITKRLRAKLEDGSDD